MFTTKNLKDFQVSNTYRWMEKRNMPNMLSEIWFVLTLSWRSYFFITLFIKELNLSRIDIGMIIVISNSFAKVSTVNFEKFVMKIYLISFLHGFSVSSCCMKCHIGPLSMTSRRLFFLRKWCSVDFKLVK